ncbi:hypothetical protein MNEG_8312 [Monoraphidium neglectum]|uniref:Uncharacterized protein n=1 Tax=Monoraphidium neglectum TaxID=145388 RepID=A0A0D2KWN7_9CHLO|nr:hypothetical protein MNEG_8312 [Monoraphidium neglectum]KIY99653.1 hypothetical protein MNEG_8312 [Monoraphidium neglectum]|eukprot:XP_013898673.1 hypothetical protein MNEG_8312 [Monoraphidium neglectum]
MEGQVATLVAGKGQNVRLERVTLVNATLGPPSDPRGALSPRWLDTSRAASLWLVDTLVFTSAKVLGQYTAFLLSQRAAAGGRTQTRFYTDNRTFLHLNEWTAPSGARATNVGILLVGAGDNQLRQPLAGAPLEPPAPVLLSATNETLVPLLRWHAAVQTPEPLLVYLGSNVTLGGGTSAADGGAGAGAGAAAGVRLASASAASAKMLAAHDNITVARPVILVGHARDPTSIDFRMRVNQFAASGPFANLTLDSLILENLGFGDVISAPTAEGVNLQSTVSFWPFWFNRNERRLTLRNCTAIIPRSEIDFIIYWASMFEAGVPSVDWMRTEIGITAYKVRNLNDSGDAYTIVDLRGKGLTFENVQLQVKNRVAPQLPLPAPDGRVAAPLQPTARRPPRLQSVRNTRELQGGTAVDLGAGAAAPAAPLLRLPAGAEPRFLELRFMTLTGIGPGGVAGVGGGGGGGAGDPVAAYFASEAAAADAAAPSSSRAANASGRASNSSSRSGGGSPSGGRAANTGGPGPSISRRAANVSGGHGGGRAANASSPGLHGSSHPAGSSSHPANLTTAAAIVDGDSSDAAAARPKPSRELPPGLRRRSLLDAQPLIDRRGEADRDPLGPPQGRGLAVAGAAPPSDAGAAPPARCWGMLLWALARDFNSVWSLG